MQMRSSIAEQHGLHVARQGMSRSAAACPDRDGGESAVVALRSVAGPVRSSLPEASRPAGAVPIWFAVLMASSCRANANGENHAIRWDCVSGRAEYTNRGGDAERIEPLGVSLMGGETLAVCWMPGETAYTLEVYAENEKCA
jgi:hypothetical protein